MIPLQLTLSGFLSYRDRVELDFTGFDLACIAGSNGAGKSSLLDAITWSLFGQARKRDDSLINSKEDIAEVSLIFSYEGNLYRVLRIKPRNKTTRLEFHILQDAPDDITKNLDLESGTWKPLTERTLRDTEARIQETLRLDYETFVNASFFLQGKADQFTQQRPGDRKRILASILGLEIWETYRQQAAERRRAIENDIHALEGRMQEITSELAEETSRTARLQELERELAELSQSRAIQEDTLENMRQIAATLAEQERLVGVLARQRDEAIRNLEELKNRLAARQEERQSFNTLLSRSAEIESVYTKWNEARESLEHWEEVAARFREEEKRRQGPLDEINAARASLLQERQGLESQQTEIQTTLTETPQIEKDLSTAKGSTKDAEHRLARRKQLQEELQSALGHQADARAENPRLKAEMDELKGRIDQLSAAEGASCPLCGQPLSQTERQSLIDRLQAEGEEMGDKYRANQELVQQTGQQVRDLEDQIKSLSTVEGEIRHQEKTIAQLSSRLELLNTQVNQWQSKSAPRLADINASLEGDTFAPEARERLALVNEQLKTIGYDAAAHDSIRKAESEGRVSEAEIRALEKARSAIAPLEREIADLETQAANQEIEVARKQEEHAAAAEALEISRQQVPDQDAAEGVLLNLQERENRLRMEVGAAKQKVLILDDLKSRYAVLEVERSEQADQVAQHKQLERAFGKDGVPALLIEQALPQIESKANEILDRLTMGDMSVRFVTQAAYKDKHRDDLRETLEIQISDSAGVRDYEMFSGGEAFRVNFAIRLALSEILSQRAGARLQTLVIDEGFGSQDALGRQRLVEAINLVRQDFAKILVITHIDELKESFPNRIEVEKTTRGSTVTVV
ncbi:MAG: SMC family ATPase [Chloroflexi bacterium]|nr:SMC family ATPase [Chloroflexota bacterium]